MGWRMGLGGGGFEGGGWQGIRDGEQGGERRNVAAEVGRRGSDGGACTL